MVTTIIEKTDKKPANKVHFKAENILIYKDDILKISAIPNGSVDFGFI